MRPFVSCYQKDRVIPMIINAFTKEEVRITSDQIKVWSCDYMRVNDVIAGIKHVKSLNQPLIIYTNTVPLKEKLAVDYNIRIYDIVDLRKMAEKQSDYNLYDEL